MTDDKTARTFSIHDRIDDEGKLPDGVKGTNIPTDFHIPGADLADVDRAMFTLFNKKLKLEVSAGQQTVPVDTIFAGGERFAIIKRGKPPKDNSGAFILPLVSIRRTSIEQSEHGTIPGRGMGQDTGEIVIKKRLSKKDPKFQNLLNKLQLENQDNVATVNNRISDGAPQGSNQGTVASRRHQQKTFNTITGEMLAPDISKNIVEIITMPFPHFYTALYEITFWTQYVQHMNSLIERFMTSYDAQGNQFRLDTDKGYWFVGYVDDDFSSEDNFTEYTGDERFVKYKFTMKVPAYFHAIERKGSGIPFRRFLSAPQLSFGLHEGTVPASIQAESPVGTGNVDKFILSDVDKLDKRGNRVESERIDTLKVLDIVKDPFSGKDTTRHLKVLSRNQRKGETVISKRLITKIDDINF